MGNSSRGLLGQDAGTLFCLHIQGEHYTTQHNTTESSLRSYQSLRQQIPCILWHSKVQYSFKMILKRHEL